MKLLVDKILNELNYSQFLDKQADISKLFPLFKPRVAAVKARGGVSLERMTPHMWEFAVHSGTKNAWWYVKFYWDNIEEILREAIYDPDNWDYEADESDKSKVAMAIMMQTRLRVVCSCPSDKMWGFHYIRTRDKAKYTSPERRPPNIRNPRQRGFFCKHIMAVMDALPNYKKTIEKWMEDFHSEAIRSLEGWMRGKVAKDKEGEE